MKLFGYFTYWRRRTGINSIRDKHNGAVLTAQLFGGLLQGITNRGIALSLKVIDWPSERIPHVLLRPTHHVDITASGFLILRGFVDRATIRDESQRDGAAEFGDKTLGRVLSGVKAGLPASILDIHRARRVEHKHRRTALCLC